MAHPRVDSSTTLASSGTKAVSEISLATYTNYQREIYTSFQSPPFTTRPDLWERLAQRKVPAPNFGYVQGSAGLSRTYAANLGAFDRYRLRPRMLVDVTKRANSVEVFGTTFQSPIIVAPIGVQSIMHKDAEEATARASRNLNVPMILSTAATRTIEQVAAANGNGTRWFQLYWPKPGREEITASLLKRAADNGFSVLVVTLDTFTLGWRPLDLDHSYLPFIWGEGCQIGLSDPVFQKFYQEKLNADKRSIWSKLGDLWNILKSVRSPFLWIKILINLKTIMQSQAWIDVINSGTHREWEGLNHLKELWKGPIVLKGIQSIEDAHKAIEYGMDGIIVSNHGGRQLDGATASLDALAEITQDEKVKKSSLTVLFDSGIRTGSDVLKAIALGAKAVLIGRPYVYGLAIGGQAGVEHVLRCLLSDTDNTLANLGKKSIRELSREDLQLR